MREREVMFSVHNRTQNVSHCWSSRRKFVIIGGELTDPVTPGPQA